MGARESYSRDLIKLFLQFMGVAFCSIPATAIYFLTLRGGANNFLARVLSLALGAILAYLVWRWLDRVIVFGVKPEPVTFEIVYIRTEIAIPAQEFFALAGTLAVVMAVGSGQPSTLSIPSSQRNEPKSTNVLLERINAVTDS